MHDAAAHRDGIQERSALWVCTLSSFLVPFIISAVNVAMPVIQADLNLKAVAMTWVPTVYMLAMAITLVPVGALADLHGRRKIFGIGLIVFTAASGLAGLSPNAAMLILSRALQGIGAGMFVGTGMAILTSVFPPEKRGRVLGIYTAAVYLGVSAGPFIGGILTGHFGWRSLFFLMLPLGLVCILLTRLFLRGEWQGADTGPFDLGGSILYAIAVASLVYGASIVTTGIGAGLTVFGLLCGFVFFLHQYRSVHPVLDVRLFTGNHAFTFSCLAALLNYSATFAVTFLLSLYLQYIQNMTPQAAGTLLVVQPVVMALGSPLVGRLSERIEARWLTSGGMLMTTIGIACYTQLDGATPRSWILANLVFLGAGFALFSSPNISAIMGSVDKGRYGVASGVVAVMRLLGQMLSMAMATVVLALMLGNVLITPSLYPRFLRSIHVVFACSAALCALGVFFSFARGKTGGGVGPGKGGLAEAAPAQGKGPV